MTFALYANTVSPHQLPLAREIVSRLGAENYRYIYTDQLTSERVNLGWDVSGASWLMHYSLPGAMEWLRDADVVMMQHHRDWNLLENRLSLGKTCLYPSERWFKPPLGMLRLLWPRYFMMARRFVRMLERYDRLIYLPQGIHAARDMARLCGLMHGDLRCLFRAPEVEFERRPGGRIFLTQSSRETYPPLEGGRDPWGSDQAERSECREKQRGSKYGLDKMRMWGYFVESSEFGVKSLELREDAVKLTTPPLLHSSILKVLWVGRLLDCKCVDTIIRAVGELSVSSQRLAASGNEFRRRAEERIEEWLDDVSENKFATALDLLLNAKLASGEYRLRKDDERESLFKGAIGFFKEFSRKIVQLSDGRCVYFVPDDRSRKRNPDKAFSWAEYAVHAVTSSGKLLDGKTYRERLYNHEKASSLHELEAVIKNEVCMYRLIDAHPENDAVLFVGTNQMGARMDVVTRLDSFGNADANLAEVTVVAMHKRKREFPPSANRRPLAEVVETVAKHQAAGFSPSTTASIVSKLGAERKRGELAVGGSRISLDIYGTGPEEGRLKKLAEKYGEAIKFHPPVPIGEVRGLMREHDVYVLSSDAHEGWGAVVSEALEEGMKVIGSYEAGSSATMLPESHLFHAGDWRALANLLQGAVQGKLKPTGIGAWTAKMAAKGLLDMV